MKLRRRASGSSARPEDVGPGVFVERLVGLEIAMGAVAPRMHHALGDALIVEMEDFLAEMEILDQRRPTLANL
jgi:hypothetical protein